MLDRMKDLGFKYSSRAGITVGVSDVFVLPNKYEILADSQSNVDKITTLYRRGLLTEEERYQNVIAQWQKQKISSKINLWTLFQQLTQST